MNLDTILGKSRHIVMAILFLAMGIAMLFTEKLRIDMLKDFDPIIRYIFGGICLLYGAFRIFRIISER